ncbi:Vacuolar protein sorting-associated-like protein [Ceratobasidium theobromae]|uniref:E3 ubiquitin-protein ligase PEP5 n=1 Tax=Ceratobasidium theobromae TaxID=1582974 RepID=A0A5N5QK34_9AGAM|nr:Vacuolar protein sorting-associated-like protein [Ceratobasidium theobromae]
MANINTTPAPAHRTFDFFTSTQVKDANDLASSPAIFKNVQEISVVESSSHGVVLADIHGAVSILDRSFEPIKSWIAYPSGRTTHAVERKGILVTVGEEPSSRLPQLKVWDLEHVDKKSANPTQPILLRSAAIKTSQPHPVMCVALTSTLSHFALAMGDGTVLLYRHFDQSLSSGSGLVKPKAVMEGTGEPVTGLGFNDLNEAGEMHLFIVNTTHVYSLPVGPKARAQAPTVVDEIGTDLGCAAMHPTTGQMVVARKEALYMCGPSVRGRSYAYEGEKTAAYVHGHYVITVSPPITATADSSHPTVRNFAARLFGASKTSAGSSGNAVEDLESAGPDISRVAVLDPELTFVAWHGAFSGGVKAVFAASVPNSTTLAPHVLTTRGNLVRLTEVPVQTMIQTMERQGRFVMALGLAKNRGVDEAGVAEIHRVYGDYMYGKGDGDGAMAQYVQTVGFVRPSYVIRKFLDAQRILNLVTYLQVLHSRGLANADHTTLLLNTYTKLKDVDRLDQFIKSEVQRPPTTAQGANAADSTSALPFDLDTAIRVCRQAGYFEHAAYLAKKYVRHEEYLRIQVEDAQNYKEALEYLRGMGEDATEGNMARYGRALLDHLPDETTNLLVELCSGGLQTKIPPKVDNEVAESPVSARLLEPPARSKDKGSRERGKEDLKLRTNFDDKPSLNSQSQTNSAVTSVSPSPALLPSPLPPPPPPPSPPSPRQFFAHFVAHPKQFVQFLECVAEKRWGQSVDSVGVVTINPPNRSLAKLESEQPEQTAVWNTLLELYLTSADNKAKAIGVLRSGGDTIVGPNDPKLPFDTMHALILCSTFQFTDGLVLLWEQMGMYEDVLRFWMERALDPGIIPSSPNLNPETESKKASQRVLVHLENYGTAYPHLYELVLRFLTSTPELLHRHSEDVTKILDVIEREKIMPPLGVVQVLARNGVASVGLVKQWLVARIQESRVEVESDRRLIESYRSETKAKLQEISELSDPEHPRVFHVTRCATCGNMLDLPTIHFMCKHSYHQKCLPDQDIECPICARQHSVIREVRRTNERLADAHNIFLSGVTENGFEAIAAAFGRGVLRRKSEEDGSIAVVV